MAKDKKGFILYADLLTVVEKLVIKDREDKTNYGGELFLHILKYVNDKEPIPLDFIIELSFEPIKLQLKRDLEKFEQVKAKRSDAGLKSAEARRVKNSLTKSTSVESVEHTSTNPTVNVNVNVNDNVNDIDINKKKFVFRKSLLSYGFEKKLIDDWIKVRKTKKLTNTETAYKSFIIEIEKTKMDKNKLLKKIVESSWGGFKKSWLENNIQKKPNKKDLSKDFPSSDGVKGF